MAADPCVHQTPRTPTREPLCVEQDVSCRVGEEGRGREKVKHVTFCCDSPMVRVRSIWSSVSNSSVVWSSPSPLSKSTSSVCSAVDKSATKFVRCCSSRGRRRNFLLFESCEQTYVAGLRRFYASAPVEWASHWTSSRASFRASLRSSMKTHVHHCALIIYVSLFDTAFLIRTRFASTQTREGEEATTVFQPLKSKR